jgi:hypothetical protein
METDCVKTDGGTNEKAILHLPYSIASGLNVQSRIKIVYLQTNSLIFGMILIKTIENGNGNGNENENETPVQPDPDQTLDSIPSQETILLWNM